jgi:hypothetical protein
VADRQNDRAGLSEGDHRDRAVSCHFKSTPRAPLRAGRAAAELLALDREVPAWADIIPAEFDVYPLVDLEATRKMLAAQVAAHRKD